MELCCRNFFTFSPGTHQPPGRGFPLAGFLHLQKGPQIDELRAPRNMGALLEADGHSRPPTGPYSCVSHSSRWSVYT
ncbi:unnamed protein product, partial [Gulo gulo]